MDFGKMGVVLIAMTILSGFAAAQFVSLVPVTVLQPQTGLPTACYVNGSTSTTLGCSDPDGGLNYFAASTTSGAFVEGSSNLFCSASGFPDACANSTQLWEGACGLDVANAYYGAAGAVLVDCPTVMGAGATCSAGRCMPAVIPSSPDLSVGINDVNVAFGNFLNVTFTISNNGNAPVTNLSKRMIIANAHAISSGIYPSGTVFFEDNYPLTFNPPLLPGQSHMSIQVVQVPFIASSPRSTKMIVDSAFQYDENNEFDNATLFEN